jgi:hypothetical protein
MVYSFYKKIYLKKIEIIILTLEQEYNLFKLKKDEQKK